MKWLTVCYCHFSLHASWWLQSRYIAPKHWHCLLFFKQEPVPRFWLLIRNNISNLNDTSSKYHKHQNSALTVILRHTMYTVFVWHCMLSIFITFNKMSILNAILKVTCCSFYYHFLQCKIKVCQGSHRVSPFFGYVINRNTLMIPDVASSPVALFVQHSGMLCFCKCTNLDSNIIKITFSKISLSIKPFIWKKNKLSK